MGLGVAGLLLTALLILPQACSDRDPSTSTGESIVVRGPVRFNPEAIPYPMLSDYAFFTGDQARLQPNAGVLPYELITPLFTDYAHKARFVWMPEGAQAEALTDGTILFPDQTVLIKTFYYPADFRQPEKAWNIIETRLLVKRAGAWEAFSYLWNADRTDARLKNTGDIQEVSWVDEAGRARTIDYVVPNKNQCKSCHQYDNVIEPLGPKMRNLQKRLHYPDGTVMPQLVKWQEVGLLAPGPLPESPPLPDWENNGNDLEPRALAYLDVNCGHCHRAEGSAKTTGMFLNWEEKDPAKWGRCKPPVAAGRGSGGLHFGIMPGQAQQSILLHRMQSDDPGVMMPELGRVIGHTEGIELIRDWIESMEGGCPPL